MCENSKGRHQKEEGWDKNSVTHKIDDKPRHKRGTENPKSRKTERGPATCHLQVWQPSQSWAHRSCLGLSKTGLVNSQVCMGGDSGVPVFLVELLAMNRFGEGSVSSVAYPLRNSLSPVDSLKPMLTLMALVTLSRWENKRWEYEKGICREEE